MKNLICIVQKKKLNRAEKRSLLSSIAACHNFGVEAHNYVRDSDVYDSIVFSYCRTLRYFGIPFISFRETERYKFMLELSIQQTWSLGIGEALTNTKFFNASRLPTYQPEVKEDYFDLALSTLKKNKNYEEVASILKASNPDIRYISILDSPSQIILCTYTKKTNKFNIHKGCFSTSNLTIYAYESDIKAKEKANMMKKKAKEQDESCKDSEGSNLNLDLDTSSMPDDNFLMYSELDKIPEFGPCEIFEDL